MMQTTLEQPQTDTARQTRRRRRFNPEGVSNEPLHPRQAAVELQPDFRSIARQLCPGDLSTQDDLVQEMSLAALLCREPQTRSMFRWLAGWRAVDYLRWWTLPLRMRTPGVDLDALEQESPEVSEFAKKLNKALSGED